MQWMGIQETRISWFNRTTKWHQWFAWFPVVVEWCDVENKIKARMAWLEIVWRRNASTESWVDPVWIYKAVEGGNE